MYELIKISENDYYIDCPAKIGMILRGDNAYLIDSGNDKDAAKKIKKHLDGNSWTLNAIFNTHSHADHIGGNEYLQSQTGCKIYANGIERDCTCHPVLEPSLLYGGNPPTELRKKFLMAQPSKTEYLTERVLPNGVEIVGLAGHSVDMVGFKTADGTAYIADSLSSAETLDKYKINYNYDIAAYLESLEKLKNLDAKIYVPSHAAVTDNIAELAQYNIDKVNETAELIVEICKSSVSADALIKAVFDKLSLTMSFEQNALIGSTLKSYLTWLKGCNRVEALIEDNTIVWKSLC